MKECGHSLCTDCFGEYLKEKFKGGPECVYTTCSDHTCGMIVPAELFKKFLSKKDYAKYESYVLKSFVELSAKTKWCPGKDCDKACESKYEEQIDVECDCGTEFCFSCTKEAHMPISCDQLQQWLDRVDKGDQDTSNWIKLNTKKCPKCKASIQKNSGCMHMTCKCGY